MSSIQKMLQGRPPNYTCHVDLSRNLVRRLPSNFSTTQFIVELDLSHNCITSSGLANYCPVRGIFDGDANYSEYARSWAGCMLSEPYLTYSIQQHAGT